MTGPVYLWPPWDSGFQSCRRQWLGGPLPGGMVCPSCGHISKETAPKFCSECGHHLLPAVPAPDSKDGDFKVISAPEEEKMECGEELKEEGSSFSSLGSSDLQENPDEPCSEGSWTVKVSKKKRKKDKKDRKSSPSAVLDSPPLSSSGPCSASSFAPAGRVDPAPQQSHVPQGGSLEQPLAGSGGSETGCDRDLPGSTPVEVEGHGGGATPPAGSPGEAAEAGRHPQSPTGGGVSARSPGPQALPPGGASPGGASPEGKGQPAPDPSASGAGPAAKEAVQALRSPESKGDPPEPQKGAQTDVQLANAQTLGAANATAMPVDPAAEPPTKEVENQMKKTKEPPAGSRTSGQEGETKDDMAVPGEKAGREEKAKPGDPKKAAVPGEKAGGEEKAKPGDPKKAEDRNYAMAVKSTKEQRDKEAGAQEVKTSTLSPGEGIRVYFHAIISRHFSFNSDQHKVFIRGGEEFGKPRWKYNVCEMYCTKDLHNDGLLIEGSTIISKRILDRAIPYKYVIVRDKNSEEYEFIYQHQQKENEHVNRCLRIKSSLLGSGEWHQYDDIICMRPTGKVKRFMDYLTSSSRKDLLRGKQIAAAVMLDSIFSILQTWNNINLKNFFTQLMQFYFVIREPTIYEGEPRPWSTLQYEESAVKKDLWKYLEKQMAPFLDKSDQDSLPEDWPVRNKLRMGLIVLFSMVQFGIPLSRGDLYSLCYLLCPDVTSLDAFHRDLACTRQTAQSWRVFLVNLYLKCMEERVPFWVYTLPVLHYFMDLSPPGKDFRIQPQDTWAGLEGISFSQFREEASQLELLYNLLRKKHLLKLDECLFRSWFSLLPLSSLCDYMEDLIESLDPLDCFLGIYYRVQELQKIYYVNFEDIENLFKKLLHILETNSNNILRESRLPSYLIVCLKLHETVCKITKSEDFYEIPVLSAEIVCKVIALEPLEDSAETWGDETGKKMSAEAVFQGALTATRNWLQSVFKKSMFQNTKFSSEVFTYPQEMKIWRQMVEIKFPAGCGWQESLLGDMEGRLKQERPLLQISAYCSTDWDRTNSKDSVAKTFEKCVLEAVSSACQSQTSILDGLSCQDWRKFGTLMSAVITKSWPVNHGEFVCDLDEVFKHLLSWPDVKHLFKLCGADEKILANITEEGKKLMAVADSVLTTVVDNVLNGTILIRQLNLIISHWNRFLRIWQLKGKSLPPEEQKYNLKEVLTWRQLELVTLQREKRQIGILLKLCEKVKHLIEVDFGEIAQKHAEDLNGKRLNDVVMVRQPTSSHSVLRTYYNLSPHLQKVTAKVDLLKDSHIFQVFWEEAAELLNNPDEESEREPIQLEDVYKYLYLPCYEKFAQLYQDLKLGEVTFAEIDAIFKDFVNKYKDLADDLQIMCAVDRDFQNDWVSERVEQIKEYHHLHQAVDSAKVILKVKENLGLTGDFSVIHTLLSFTEALERFHHEKLKQISPVLIRARRLLQDINETRHQCLEELSLRREFLSWVREALGDINELKVFVDLASISAGENDIDVDRVACFHDAVQGYAPLLYKLDASAGFDEFMEHLKELWKALENDPYLPRKLCDSARNLEWLKTVKESHGSVELSSLSLATAINSRGIYVIKAPMKDQRICQDTVLRLLLPESHGGREERREYSLEELKELLNKLMLMSGKKEQNHVEVETFSEVFCNMQRLVQSFINLYLAGNMLFRTWVTEVYCCPQRVPSIHMDFGLEPVDQLSGSGPVAPLLEALCRQMERFLEEWQRFVVEKRREHFYLNFYTAEQLVYLSTELPKPSPSEAALIMLSFIKGDCTPSDLLEARRGSGGEARRRETTVMAELPLLLFAESGLMNKLRVIMEQSMECMGTFLPSCLDLDALGRCLAHLARLGGPPVERRLPRGLQAGRPNLVVCSHAQVLPAALALYMQVPDQPLPTYDEVLLCTPTTAFEEVALLLRRCLTPGRPGRRVYSLLYADQLSYDVACRVEGLFHSLCLQPHPEDYRLVLLCDSEREHCYLPSAFSQFKVLVTPQEPLDAIQRYLASHFQVPRQTQSAAAVFGDSMCVGVVSSERAGVGKSLYVKRLHHKLKMKFKGEEVPLKVIRLIDRQVDENKVLGSLLPFLRAKYKKRPVIFHFDVTSSVQTGIWGFLFKLLILQYLMDINGKMWLRNQCHLYIIEILEENAVLPKRSSKLNARAPQFSFLDVFPKVQCRPPKEVMDMGLHPESNHREPGMDPSEFRSETFQRPYQYLKRFHQKQNLDTFWYQEGSVEDTPGECLQHLLFYCGVINPSWSELQNFARFLNCQLKDCEASLFCNPNFVGDTLRGFKNFVITFMIFMARDFATPTLDISDQSPGKHHVPMEGVTEEDLAPFTLRKRWESEPHPYVFFNSDRISMTFMGFHFRPNQNGGMDAINHVTGRVIKKDIMTNDLYKGLLLQKVPFNVDFDRLPRHEKLEKLCLVLGIQWAFDPDETYELTTDNVLKLLAIEMRFRCGIPVIIMGETGCGKTRLIRFLSDLRRGCVTTQTMKLVKVHGGTTANMIYSKVIGAECLAISNKCQYQLDTTLFFDEANTTEAVSCIKEVLCDGTVDGEPLDKASGLHIIAACNPYRKHSQEMICRLESAGLGYRVRAEETADKLGSIPLRQLVYRVHALPPSLIPLVWDFGQLNNIAEKLYIQQIVQRLMDSIEMDQNETCLITEVLSASQSFMRKRENECSFVSLRDVERCVKVFKWFYEHSDMLLSRLESFLSESNVSKNNFERCPVLWSLVLAIGICYHASLENKDSYLRAICRFFPEPYNSSKFILDEITHAQDLFLNGVSLRKTIAKNLALKENVFMMVICIELKIPLFLVGKPGSSKSLAKTIVADAMQGPAAYSDLFKNLKQVHLVSFQCSPHSTPQGIISTFRQCARFQQGKDLQQYVSVVVLDEVGLAEDSPKMPLKTLHPLLEDGCIDDDPAPHKVVGFVGISNWALDPAKMNRGIFVSRGSPNEKELIESARGICASDMLVKDRIQGYFASFAKAYETICKSQDKEFFGLRDYYSLIKMVFAMAKASNKEPSPQEIAHAILRNFSGKDDIRPLEIFMATLPETKCSEEVSTIQLIEQNIYGDHPKMSGGELEEAECRYLLVLTKNYMALQILQQTFFNEDQQPEIIFGSSFPKDQEYTQICRNINRVKICMETGKMAVLLNLQNLYESLYDALNQYYVYLGGQKYVDLGLGTHRVKCRVHPGFRLIVIEEKDVVYRQFPIPLINRLEKHYLDINTVLERWQKNIVKELKAWVEKFVNAKAKRKYSPSDVFIGYHSAACASAVLRITERLGPRNLTDELYLQVSEESKLLLLDCATPDAVVRLSASTLGSFAAQSLAQEYFYKQHHDSFVDFLQAHLQVADSGCRAIFTEITTFSRLLTSHDCELLEAELTGRAQKPTLLSLQQFDTEYSFLKEVRNCLTKTAGCKILIIQTDFEDGVRSAQLIASAKYSALNEINKMQVNKDRVLVYFITKLSRMGSETSYVGFHGGLWQSVHIDDLRKATAMTSDVTKLQGISISQLFAPADKAELERGYGAEDDSEEVDMETDKLGDMAEEEMETGSQEMESESAKAGRSDVLVLDTTSLLRSCVQTAVGMLRDENESFKRNMQRVTILLSLLNEDDEFRASFLRVSKTRLYFLLKKQEENYLHYMKEWVMREASNLDALQEAGTFRHSLWKRIQNAVTPLLASIISFIDRDCNLELLVRPDCPPWTRSLWMFIFNDLKLLNIPLVMNDARAKGEMSYIMVQNNMKLSEDISNDIPFSWRIKDHLEELWIRAQYIKDADGLSEKLVEIFQQTPLGKFLAQFNGAEQQMLLQGYVKDFLLLTMSVSTWDELKFLQIALWSCINELKAASRRPEEEISLPWVHLAYQRFRSRLQNFSRILAFHPQILQCLMEVSQNRVLSDTEMTLDAFAAMACVEMLTRDTLKPSPQAWLQMVKNLSMPLELVCADGHMQDSGDVTKAVVREVRVQWNRIFSVALFVEHVLLGTKSEIPELYKLVMEYVSSLDKCLQEDSDIKTHRPFVAVLSILCKCKEQASQTLARFGVQPCPICLGDTQDPVSLPCEHVFCHTCLKTWLIQGQKKCPFCSFALPNRFQLTVSQNHRVATKKHAQFRQMCNSFFVDLVSTMCFKDNVPPEKKVVEDLLSLLFVEKELLRDAPQRCREHTKSLSPFDDVVDKTPVIRSVVLKLLLKYSFHEVKDYIQDYLSLLQKKRFIIDDKTELYMLFINCLEDSIHEKTSACSKNDELNYMREEEHFLKTCSLLRQGQNVASEASVEYLQVMARIRLCLDRASDFLFELLEASEVAKEKQCYLRQVEGFCTQAKNDWYHVYLVRRLTNQYGMEFVQSLSKQGHPCQWVFPKEVITQQKDHPGQMDRYLVYGDEYKAIRNAVGKAVLECKPLAIVNTLKACRSPGTQQAVHLLLALFREVTVLYRSCNANLHPKPKQCEALNKFLEETTVLSSHNTRHFATSLVANTLPLLTVGPGEGSLEGRVIEMAIHAAAVLLCGQNKVLEPLRNLAFFPTSMANAFLPTMPEDLLAQARSWGGLEGVHWYTCPRGHPCSVGECGKPMERSYCVDCGVPIGGINHIPQAGFQVINDNTDRTQTGHVLGSPGARGAATASDRGLAPVAFILIRLLTHLAMLLGASRQPQVLINLIKPPVRDPTGFLQQHLQKDLEHLTKMLGQSIDETSSVVHLVLGGLLKKQHPEFSSFDENLSTKEKRNGWERAVAPIILSELEHLDKTLLTVNTRISQDERISSNPVAKIVYGDPVTFLSKLPQDSVVHCSKIWSCRKKVTVEYLQHIVEQKNGKETVPVLWQFLQKEAELRLVKFLPEILDLQRNLVKRFQNVSEVEYSSIQAFISSHSSDGLKQLFEHQITTFLSTWNKLRRSLETNGEIKLPKEYCSTDLNMDTNFEVLLPRRRGLGLCSTALVSYLMKLHNEIIYTVEKFSKESNSYSVDASDITDLQVISYEVERDLTPLILSNCQYKVEPGGETLQEFDLEKIQRQITSRFLQGKPRFTLKGIPTLVYRHDWNYERLFTEIKNRMSQSSLPNSAIGAISGQLPSFSDACEALSLVEVALGFLSTAGGDPNMYLKVYIQDILRMGDQSVPVVKALSRCQLKHTIALWQLLSTHKSEQLLRLRKDPFRDISSRYKEDLSPENAKLLSTFLNQTSLDAFLLELHELMVLKLKNSPGEETFKPQWSLRDTLVSYMETKDSEVLPEMQSQFPQEILLSTCASVWKMAAELKQDRLMR
ncbi:E3 ubiquitin-protein ligase RNF213 isoform X2 [Tamandua tetradactyla]|uniref:E3 ubiquitin-protein ligase RNF213 isoform X2 n=1 Tax=Tamandua tetradactyla TaxID=48850 RepID=UPI0040543741